MTKLLLLTCLEGAALDRFVRAFGLVEAVTIVRDRTGLEAASIDATTTLVSYGTGTIVPAAILNRLPRPAYNLHAASPEFPGRDPHHWAIYDGAVRYGATMHVMAERVDAGAIVDVEWFGIGSEATPAELLAEANAACFRIIRRVGPSIGRGEVVSPLSNVNWSGRKRSRRDFLAMCHHMPLDLTKEEFERRFRAFDGSDYDNLTISFHGKTFRIDKNSLSIF